MWCTVQHRIKWTVRAFSVSPAFFEVYMTCGKTHSNACIKWYAHVWCLFVIHSHKFLYMKYCWTNKCHFWGWKSFRLNTKFACCESYHISSFQACHKFTEKLLVINTCLVLSYQQVEKKIETVAWTPGRGSKISSINNKIRKLKNNVWDQGVDQFCLNNCLDFYCSSKKRS